jgi:predicted ATPase
MSKAKTNRAQTTPPRIVYLLVKNYRALHNVELRDLPPLTVLLGPNGSGKSTVFDPERNRSRSFGALRDVLMEVMA